MEEQLYYISEAARIRPGPHRTTISRWISEGRMGKSKDGKISLRDVERCWNEQRTGRWCGSSATGKQSQAATLSQPFLQGAEKGRLRLKRVLFYCAKKFGERGHYEWFRVTLGEVNKHAWDHSPQKADTEAKIKFEEELEREKRAGDNAMKLSAKIFAENRARSR